MYSVLTKPTEAPARTGHHSKAPTHHAPSSSPSPVDSTTRRRRLNAEEEEYDDLMLAPGFEDEAEAESGDNKSDCSGELYASDEAEESEDREPPSAKTRYREVSPFITLWPNYC